jgi:hypothetical protein
MSDEIQNDGINIEQQIENNTGSVIAGIGTITGDINQTRNTYYDNPVLVKKPLKELRDPHAVAPSNLGRIVTALRKHHLTILEAPPFWGERYLAAQLARQIITGVLPTPEESESTEDAPLYIYESTGNVNGLTVTGTLYSRKEREDHIQDTVILLSDVTADDYPASTLNEMQHYGQENNVYIILLTQPPTSQWHFISNEDMLFSLTRDNPYQPGDIALWMSNIINSDPGTIRQLIILEVIQSTPPITPETTLHNLTSTDSTITLVDLVSNYANIPQHAIKIDGYINQATEPTDILTRIRDEDSEEKRLKRWFDELSSEEERYVVLAISLISDIPPQTFWAIYEKLIEQRWRLRDTNLKMSDYHGIQKRLSEHIQAQEDRIGFKLEGASKTIISHALDSYRRSLVNALPLIANLVIKAERSPESSLASLTEDIFYLEVWGTDLMAQSEQQTLQQQLRNSLINSIVEIGTREPQTTEYVLQAWAEQPYFGKKTYQPTINNVRVKLAFSDTLLRFHRSDTPQRGAPYWESRRSLELLSRWYSTVKPELYTFSESTLQDNLHKLGEQVDRNSRRANIRMTVAFTLCALSRDLPNADEFGRLDTGGDLMTAPPVNLPTLAELPTMWSMLVAMAWETDMRIRQVIALQMDILSQFYVDHMLALMLLLAGDPKRIIRITVAQLLRNLVVADRKYLQYIHHLLTCKDAAIPQSNIKENHPLYREFINGRDDPEDDIKPHVWTATFAMVLYGSEEPAAFRAYLSTLLTEVDSDRYRAFTAVIRLLCTNFKTVADMDSVPTSVTGLQKTFRFVLKDRDRNNTLSTPARTLETLLHEQGISLGVFLDSNAISEFRIAKNPTEFEPHNYDL